MDIVDEAALVEERCDHEWVAGMMIVHPEDLAAVARDRKVECSKCDEVCWPA